MKIVMSAFAEDMRSWPYANFEGSLDLSATWQAAKDRQEREAEPAYASGGVL